MQIVTPPDIEALLAAYLSGKGLTASAPPLSPDYAGRLPFCVITRTGGRIDTRVICEHSIEIDAYAQTWAEAQETAASAVAWVAHAPAEDLALDGATVPVYTVSAGLPYNNPDQRHPNTPRVTVPVTVTTRGLVKEHN